MNIRVSRRESILISALGLLLILMFGLKFFVIPVYDSWVSRNAQIAALEAARHHLAMTTESGTSGDEATHMTQALFLPKAAPEDFHRYFQTLVEGSGLLLESVSISESAEDTPTGFSKVFIRLSMSGTQAQFMQFLEAVERMNKAIAVESMSFAPAGGAEVGFDVGLLVYCVENSSDESLDFVPDIPKNADEFRFSRSRDSMDGESR